MNLEKIESELKKLTLEIAPEFRETDINNETRFVEDLLFDSLMTMELIVRAEEQFGIQIEELDIEKIGVFGSLCEIIAGEMANE